MECLFFLVLEWAFPREDIHYVKKDWKMAEFTKVGRLGFFNKRGGIIDGYCKVCEEEENVNRESQTST